MNRRELLSALSVGGVTVISGCLSVVKCSPQSEWGIFVINTETKRIELDIAITRWNRDVFSNTITLPAAEEHVIDEIEYVPDVLTNHRQYTVTITHEGEPVEIITHDGKALEAEFRPTCEHMLIRYEGQTSYYQSAPVSVTSAPTGVAERWLESMDK